ncbi:hypothetical protein BBO99_00006230 [Phytophthora kernoviae]|uniref:Uncharacterized protein n=2 Tax=Phytophthora kernoviae TaxID=325452 RepID=A0A3R7J5V5_9STRA|nr:hypothetical protein G195_007419 [Phytophthora kernoviae 00238/432]RLN06866.1 hypothetical protein BBI17_006810 [Phytophthora kernoviae]RLN78061.1 hypothetical protein BBO99_00006230 [Phytophthora kernoviae]
MADTVTDNQPEPQPPTDAATNNFGDLLAQLLQSLPAEASRLFLMSLSGLSPSESGELCRYVDQLRDEKQFRVIKAMAESTTDGKKKFILSLRKKFEVQQAKLAEVQAQEEQNMESHLKRKQALNAASRVKMLNGGANKFHSFNATVGPDGKETDGHKVAAQHLAGMPNADGVVVGRSLSSSSVIISKEDISQVGRLLSNSHITDSEMNLRELEINKKGFAAGGNSNPTFSSQDDDVSAAKRERPQSSRTLVEGEQKPTQRTRSAAGTPVSGNGNNAENSNSNGESMEDPEAPTTKRWTKSQDAALRESVRIHGEKNWKAIAELVPGRNHAQCLQRWRKVLKPGLVKGHWSFEEDQVLEYLVTQGCNNWGQIAERIPGRTPKQCRERWKNHLDPAINKGPYTEEEDSVILTAQARLGNKWSQIAQLLKGRTEDSQQSRGVLMTHSPGGDPSMYATAAYAQQPYGAPQYEGQDYSANPGYDPRCLDDITRVAIVAISLLPINESHVRMADAQTLDLFDGLPLDYNFLENTDASNDGNANNVSNTFVAPDDQMLLDSDVPGSSPTNMMALSQTEKEDLLTPLSFSFNPNATGATTGPAYRVAPQHKHKRVRSNPDVLQGFGMANMAPSVITRPVMGGTGMSYPPQHNMLPIGPVQVDPPTNLMGLSGTGAPQGTQESFQEMDEFLQELSWSEITPDQQQQQQQQMQAANAGMTEGSSPSGGASFVAYRSQRIQEGVNELKMKRKRPVNHHSRHHSNPVDLLHNLDQFRILAQQTKQQQQPQQQNMNPNQGYPNPFANFQDPTVFPAPPQPNMQPNMQQYQFQVPPQIASGAVHSLHARRSSLGSNLPPRATARRRGANRSSGLSMDMSQMNLGFLSVPEEPSTVDLNSHRSPPRRSASINAALSASKKLSVDDANRKLYKCGRCGQPKVGHICTMPDQRNNWTQVDLEVTKGLKVMRVNCHIMPVKGKWVSQCDDHEPPQLAVKCEVKSEEEVEAEPLGL